MRLFVLLFSFCIAIAAAMPNECLPIIHSDPPVEAYPAMFNFGMDQDPNGQSTIFQVVLDFGFETQRASSTSWNADLWPNFEYGLPGQSIMDSFAPFFINGIPVIGGKNWSQSVDSYAPTADQMCSNNNETSMWGPAYPDIDKSQFQGINARYLNLEVYIQWNVPQATSYMRHILFVTNKGESTEKLIVQQTGYTNPYGMHDISPVNDGRYFILYPWTLDNPQLDPNYETILTSVHARGINAKDTRVGVYLDGDDTDYGVNYAGLIAAGETKAFMFIYGFGRNVSITLDVAAWIDQQKPEMFDRLTADQLSQIINWDACQVALGPVVNVTITPPATCSSGLTSDFTVQVDTARNDFTSNFTHRVTLAGGDFTVVAPTSSTTLQVVNGAGALTHQLWYNGCLVKQTPFTACAQAEAPMAAPVASTTPTSQSVPVATPTKKKSDATVLTVSAVSLIALVLF